MSTLFGVLFALTLIDTANSLALNTTSTLHAPGTSSLSPTTNLTIAAITRSCDDIHTCRTLYSIVQTCLVTIFACAWVAVHRNIPAPKPIPDPNSNTRPIAKVQQWARAKLHDLRQPFIVFSVTLLAPEWVLAWAVRQRIQAHKLAKDLEEARAEATENWKEGHPERAENQATGVAGRGKSENPIERRFSPTSEPPRLAYTENEWAWTSTKFHLLLTY